MTTPKPVQIPVTDTSPPRLRLTVIIGEEVVAMRTFPAPSDEWIARDYHPRVWESMLASQWFREVPMPGFDPTIGDRIDSEYVR